MAGSVYASPVKYTCEEDSFTNAIAPSWTAIVDADYQNARMNNFTLRGVSHNDLDYDSEDMQIIKMLAHEPNKDSMFYDFGSPIAAFRKGELDVLIYGKSNGVKFAEVILVSEDKNGMTYNCYKNGSAIDKQLTQLRDSHNKRILEEQQGN
ncbi:hypothetical protein [Buttiauxella noackiae]|uniref:hypothetical protein n=1 Tax=Buttiauxella noackiae TaxID=82992 RepID=UPI00055537D1|nr:hypothetical protein [Buttiauxella noackiae]